MCNVDVYIMFIVQMVVPRRLGVIECALRGGRQLRV